MVVWLPSVQEALALANLGCGKHTPEEEAGRSGVQDSCLRGEFETSLGYIGILSKRQRDKLHLTTKWLQNVLLCSAAQSLLY